MYSGDVPDDRLSSYDPSFEWPGSESQDAVEESIPSTSGGDSADRKGMISNAFLRFVVLHSSILPVKYKVAIVSGYPEVQFGRDKAPTGSTTPRIRLKEMEVSKVHATAFWDSSRKEWGIVDMGSKHGTFLLSSADSKSIGATGSRLSPPRVASLPRQLTHLEKLTIGSTAFAVHIHNDNLPCLECTSSGHEIPLFPASRNTDLKRTDNTTYTPAIAYIPESDRDPKKSLTLLKNRLLRDRDARPGGLSAPPAGSNYLDRAARRRQMHNMVHSDSPGVPSVLLHKDRSAVSLPQGIPEPQVSEPPRPLPETNVGHRLLSKQGWEPGTSLGSSWDDSEGQPGLVEPIEVKANQHRSGLGMKRSPPPISVLNWKEAEKRKRFSALHSLPARFS